MRQPAVCNYRQDHKRYHSRNGLSPCIAVRFVIGQNYENEKKDAPLRGKEQNAHGDIVVLPMTENMNSGKTPGFFHLVALWTSLPKSVQFVGKTDSDSFLWPQPLLDELVRLPSPENGMHFQIGDTVGFVRCGGKGRGRKYCPKDYLYMAGHGYVLSRGIVRRAFASIDITERRFRGHEDLVVGRWIHSQMDVVQIDKRTRSCFRHEEGGKLSTQPRRAFKALNATPPPPQCTQVLPVPIFPVGGVREMPLCSGAWPPEHAVCLLRRAAALPFVDIPDRNWRPPAPVENHF